MKLYIGGAWQGQEELARGENPGAEILCEFHERVREAVGRALCVIAQRADEVTRAVCGIGVRIK